MDLLQPKLWVKSAVKDTMTSMVKSGEININTCTYITIILGTVQGWKSQNCEVSLSIESDGISAEEHQQPYGGSWKAIKTIPNHLYRHPELSTIEGCRCAVKSRKSVCTFWGFPDTSMMRRRDGQKALGGSLRIPLASPDVLGSLAETFCFEQSSSPGTQSAQNRLKIGHFRRCFPKVQFLVIL